MPRATPRVMTTMGGTSETRSLSDLPEDELRGYAGDLGLELDQDVGPGELLRRVRDRQELLLELDREALLEVVVWARRPVRQSASKEVLAKRIAEVRRVRFDGLSQRGLEALARLRGLTLTPGESRAGLERRLRRSEGFWTKLRRARRGLVAGVIARAIETESAGEYRFLPEQEGPSLRQEIEDGGVVSGITRKLKGVADDYVREKLDEIEARIDGKLDEIDRRLGEWRDREVINRLKILKITLLFSILVALICLIYDMIADSRAAGPGPDPVSGPGRVAAVWQDGDAGPVGRKQPTESIEAMYEKFSPRVDKVIKLGNEIAREYDQEYVGTEHVLLAILREGTGVGARVLRNRNISEARLREEIDKLIKKSMEETWVFGRLPGSPHFKNVVATAIEQARQLESKEVCTEHLLLALCRESGSVARSALRNLGIRHADVKADILQIAPEA